MGGLMILTILVLGLVAATLTDTPTGRALRNLLVDRPARALAALTRGKIVFYVALSLAGLTAVLLFKGDGLRLFGLAAPEIAAWFVVFDVGVFIEAMLITAALISGRAWQGTQAAMQRGWRSIIGALARIRPRSRPRRMRRPQRPGRPRDPSEPGPAGFQPRPYLAFSMA